LPAFVALNSGPTSEALSRDVELAWRRGIEPISLVRDDQDQQLGVWSAARDFVTGRPKQEVLREALEYLDRDRSFDPEVPDDTFRELDAMVGGDIDVLVAGHTHLERSLPRTRGRGHYFNSGTWARLIRIDPEVRQSEPAFGQLFRLLSGASMESLDRARVKVGGTDREIVLRRNTVVVIETITQSPPSSGVDVRASLQRVLPAMGGVPFRLDSVAAAIWIGG
jgi:hypothetical protein